MIQYETKPSTIPFACPGKEFEPKLLERERERNKMFAVVRFGPVYSTFGRCSAGPLGSETFMQRDHHQCDSVSKSYIRCKYAIGCGSHL